MESMTRQVLVGAMVAFAALASAAPAAAQSRREMQMMADIRMLQEQTQQLQQQLATALAQIGEALKQLSTRQDDQTAATRKGFADQKLTVDQVGSDLRVVRERVDETNVRITSLSQEVEALRLAIPSYPPPPPTDPSLDPGAAGAAPPGAPPSTPPAVPGSTVPPPIAPVAPPAANPGISPQRLYDTAWTDYTSGQWTLCIEGFNTYLRSFPRSEAADDAQFYIGECNFADGKYTEAMDAYNRVIANYPRADKAPDAYYKRGMTFERLGQVDRARESWETLLKTFPDAEVARLGKQNLDRLARAKPRD
jgi:tol-pal system protein YbgF